MDQERGVHKAPANEPVRGAMDLAYLVSRNEQQILNPAGINVIRNLNGSILIWGARTLGGDANGDTKYVNVRRLLNFLGNRSTRARSSPCSSRTPGPCGSASRAPSALS